MLREHSYKIFSPGSKVALQQLDVDLIEKVEQLETEK